MPDLLRLTTGSKIALSCVSSKSSEVVLALCFDTLPTRSNDGRRYGSLSTGYGSIIVTKSEFGEHRIWTGLDRCKGLVAPRAIERHLAALNRLRGVLRTRPRRFL